MSKINVLTVDDNQIQSNGLRKLFEICETINYRGNITSPEKCIERILNDRMIDVVLMDISFPNSTLDGIQLTQKLREKRPFSVINGKPTAPRIVFFSVSDGGFVDLEMGVHGLIPKYEDFDTIVEMIEAVHKYGGVPKYPSGTTDKKPLFWTMLTKTEKRVFCLVMKGHATKKISEILISPGYHAVTVHRKNILRKIKESGLEVEKIDDPRVVGLGIRYKLCDLHKI